MKIKCAIAINYSGDPMIKITKDCPKLTIDVYCDDINLLTSLIDKELVLTDEK